MPFLMALGLDDAVADDRDAAHAEQRRAAVVGVVEQADQLAQRGPLEARPGARS